MELCYWCKENAMVFLWFGNPLLFFHFNYSLGFLFSFILSLFLIIFCLHFPETDLSSNAIDTFCISEKSCIQAVSRLTQRWTWEYFSLCCLYRKCLIYHVYLFFVFFLFCFVLVIVCMSVWILLLILPYVL